LLLRVSDHRQFHFEVMSAKQLVAEVVELAERGQHALICIVALPNGGLAHTRHLCQRLRQRWPQAKIIVARWGTRTATEKPREWTETGADAIGNTLSETIAQLNELAAVTAGTTQGDKVA